MAFLVQAGSSLTVATSVTPWPASPWMSRADDERVFPCHHGDPFFVLDP